jgi:Uncharacterized protein conserved in bacteria
MNRHLFTAALLLFAPLAPLPAQQDTQTPTMNPEADRPARRSNNSGPVNLKKDRPKNAKTEITAKKEATFDNNSSVAVFEGSVVVKDPQFNLFCDKLTVNLNKDRKGIETAVAEGNVTIVQENKNDKGETVKSVGRAGHATFTPSTGDIELRENPSIQQGINNHISTEPGTIMILNQEGRLKTQGGSRTIIIDATETGGL